MGSRGSSNGCRRHTAAAVSVSINHFLRLLGQQQQKKSRVLLLTWQIDLQLALGFSWGLLHAIMVQLLVQLCIEGAQLDFTWFPGSDPE
jgi:hypothetical protein